MYVYTCVCNNNDCRRQGHDLRGSRERHGRSLMEGGEGNDVNLTLKHEILKTKPN